MPKKEPPVHEIIIRFPLPLWEQVRREAFDRRIPITKLVVEKVEQAERKGQGS